MTRLPPEIWLLVIENTLHPSRTSAYWISTRTVSTLSQLCLVNREVKDLAQPILYRRVWVTLKSLRAVKKALVHDFAPSGGAPRQILATKYGRHV